MAAELRAELAAPAKSAPVIVGVFAVNAPPARFVAAMLAAKPTMPGLKLPDAAMSGMRWGPERVALNSAMLTIRQLGLRSFDVSATGTVVNVDLTLPGKPDPVSYAVVIDVAAARGSGSQVTLTCSGVSELVMRANGGLKPPFDTMVGLLIGLLDRRVGAILKHQALHGPGMGRG